MPTPSTLPGARGPAGGQRAHHRERGLQRGAVGLGRVWLARGGADGGCCARGGHVQTCRQDHRHR
eukprot:7290968-Pyramimonas_sp.AAC.1